MPKEQAISFFIQAQEDPILQEKMKALYSDNQGKVQENIVKFAAEHGFQFTIQDLEELVAEAAANAQQTGALQDAELEAIAGGNTQGWVLISIGSIGMGCILTAIMGCEPHYYEER